MYCALHFGAYQGMQDGFQTRALRRVIENACGQALTIETFIGRENIGTESLDDLFGCNAIWKSEAMRDGIGIDNGNRMFGKERCDRGFSAADAASEANTQHADFKGVPSAGTDGQ